MIGIIKRTDGNVTAKVVINGDTAGRVAGPGETILDLSIPAKLTEFNDTKLHDQYKSDRAIAYPPIGDGLDALVHKENGDEEVWEEYVERCNAVKAQFPKPE